MRRVPAFTNRSVGRLPVPAIVDEADQELRYMPLSVHTPAMHQGKAESSIAIAEKRRCVVICERINQQSADRGLYYLAAVWEQTEDPLMAATLPSCSLLTREQPANTTRSTGPLLLIEKERVPIWLKGTLSPDDLL